MRIEELSKGSYVKVPAKLETELVNVMNRFFENDPAEIENSREGIILEIQKRIRPMITNMVKRIAWVEGEAIFKVQLEAVVENEIRKIIEDIMATVAGIRSQLLKHTPVRIHVDSTRHSVDIPLVINAIIGIDIVQVFVNGMLQKEGPSYEVTSDGITNTVARTITFSDSLTSGDEVDLECWVYSAANNDDGGVNNA